ncbi:MAG: hypothetical protein IH840_17655 [Candidatus Heimdallarchaeota archaeon]|nr:hypothetical protein [Candidatus Heimdallarchaeota archaeon]
MAQIAQSTEAKIASQFSQLELSKVQREIVNKKGDIMGNILEEPSLSIRGFYALSLVEWQKKTQTTLKKSEYEIESANQRIQDSKTILEIFKNKIRKTIEMKGKIDLLDKAIAAAQRHYIANYARQSN